LANNLESIINLSGMQLLLAATIAFLGLRTAHAIPPTFGADNPGFVVEKVSPSAQFIDQQRSSRFLNQASAREFPYESDRDIVLTRNSIRCQW
jgi:hypothetical protein